MAKYRVFYRLVNPEKTNTSISGYYDIDAESAAMAAQIAEGQARRTHSYPEKDWAFELGRVEIR